MRRRKKKIEFSKKILACVALGTLAVVVAAFVLMWRTSDLSPMSFIITGIFAELASATGFYYWKAKNENMLKISGSPLPIEDEIDPEPAEYTGEGGGVG
jgi:hypothetical protein